jgi:hypothetical protein
MPKPTSIRILFGIGLFFSMLFMPWQFSLLFYLFGLVIFANFYESILFALFYDALNDPKPFAYIGLFGVALILAFAANVLRAHLREKDTHALR